ncbi:MAG: RDD family protein [Candidatus Nanopelagicales bacterium]
MTSSATPGSGDSTGSPGQPDRGGSAGSPGQPDRGGSADSPGQAAGLGRRAAAIAIDWLVALLLARLIPGAEYGTGDYALATLTIFAVEIILFTWLTGSSFGQRVVGIAVVKQDDGRLSLWRIIVRTALICIVIPALVYDSQKRGLQDLAVGSRVVMRTSIGMSR